MDKMQKELATVINGYFGVDAAYLDIDVFTLAKRIIEAGWTKPDATDNNKWIPVTERLPELHTKVLCCGIKGGRFIAELGTWGHEKHLCWDKKNGQGCPTVTHWMPLPEPPKGE